MSTVLLFNFCRCQKVNSLGLGFYICLYSHKVHITREITPYEARQNTHLMSTSHLNVSAQECTVHLWRGLWDLPSLSVPGTCTNNKADECRLPSGKIISSCPQMAHHWIVDNNKTCHGVPVPPVITTPSPKPHCEPPPLCKLILSE